MAGRAGEAAHGLDYQGRIHYSGGGRTGEFVHPEKILPEDMKGLWASLSPVGGQFQLDLGFER